MNQLAGNACDSHGTKDTIKYHDQHRTRMFVGTLHHIRKKSFSGTMTNGKSNGISVLIADGIILKKINVEFIDHSCLCKYNLSLDTF